MKCKLAASALKRKLGEIPADSNVFFHELEFINFKTYRDGIAGFFYGCNKEKRKNVV